jgi:hypothetical protein
MVTVRENDWDGPSRDHAGRDQGVAEVLGGGGEAVVLLEPVAVVVGGRDLGAQLGRSRPRARESSRSESRVRNQSGTAVNGADAAARRLDGPKHLADRAAGRLDGESRRPVSRA